MRIPWVFSPKARRIEVRFPDPSANPYLGFAAMMIFLVVLGVAYFYEIRRGGLEWD